MFRTTGAKLRERNPVLLIFMGVVVMLANAKLPFVRKMQRRIGTIYFGPRGGELFGIAIYYAYYLGAAIFLSSG